MDASSDHVIDYVRAAAMLLDLPLDTEQLHRVAAHLARTQQLAQMLAAMPLSPHDEPAEIFCPAPFPMPEGAP